MEHTSKPGVFLSPAAGQPTMVSVDVVVHRAILDEHGRVMGYWVDARGTQAYWHRNPFRRLAYNLDTRRGWSWLRPFWKTWGAQHG